MKQIPQGYSKIIPDKTDFANAIDGGELLQITLQESFKRFPLLRFLNHYTAFPVQY